MTEQHQTWIEEWGRLWILPELPRSIRIEYSTRMTRSLGRCHVTTGLIRLNKRLLDGPAELLREVLCHEVAHVAVQLLHGSSPRPHGREWAQLMTLAGYQPRARMPMECLPQSIQAGATPKRLYEHKCPICGVKRVARRPVRRWRCKACREAGLSGLLRIVTRAFEALAR